MIYIPTESLKTGMVLARDIEVGTRLFPLMTKGQILDSGHILRLNQKGVQGVYVQSSLGGDLDVREMIDKKTKVASLARMKKIFEDFSRQQIITEESLRAVAEMSRKIVAELLRNQEILINLSSLKDYDDYTYCHSFSVATLCVVIGIKMGLGESVLVDLAASGLLHDLGKMQVPKTILNKPDRLDGQETVLMQMHPEIAFEQLRPTGVFPQGVLRGIEAHHEKYDGSGYPKGLAAEKIPFYGRVLAVADVYDALTSDRPYRKAWHAHEAVEMIMGSVHSHFDYDVVKAFLQSVSVYPLGMVVRLSDGRRGVVLKNHSENTLRPRVRLISPEGRVEEDVDLLRDAAYMNLTIMGRCEPEELADLTQEYCGE